MLEPSKDSSSHAPTAYKHGHYRSKPYTRSGLPECWWFTGASHYYSLAHSKGLFAYSLFIQSALFCLILPSLIILYSCPSYDSCFCFVFFGLLEICFVQDILFASWWTLYLFLTLIWICPLILFACLSIVKRLNHTSICSCLFSAQTCNMNTPIQGWIFRNGGKCHSLSSCRYFKGYTLNRNTWNPLIHVIIQSTNQVATSQWLKHVVIGQELVISVNLTVTWLFMVDRNLNTE